METVKRVWVGVNEIPTDETEEEDDMLHGKRQNQCRSQCVVDNTAFYPNSTNGKWQHSAVPLVSGTLEPVCNVCMCVLCGLCCVSESVAVFVYQQEWWEDGVEQERPAEWTDMQSLHCPSDQAKTHSNTLKLHRHTHHTHMDAQIIFSPPHLPSRFRATGLQTWQNLTNYFCKNYLPLTSKQTECGTAAGVCIVTGRLYWRQTADQTGPASANVNAAVALSAAVEPLTIFRNSPHIPDLCSLYPVGLFVKSRMTVEYQITQQIRPNCSCCLAVYPADLRCSSGGVEQNFISGKWHRKGLDFKPACFTSFLRLYCVA